MRTLKRDTKPLYICSKINNSEPQQFREPVEVRLNTVALSSAIDIEAFGDRYKEYRKATVPIGELNKFNEGDRCYIFVDKPEKHEPLGDKCDYEIYSVTDSVSQGVIMFRRLQYGDQTY